MPPFPNISRIGLTFDLDLSPADLNIDRGHLLIKAFLPTKFEVSGAKRSWLISWTRCGIPTWPLTLTFNLLTWKSIGIIYSSRTIYLPSLKHLGQSVLEISCTRCGILTWPMTLTFDLLTWRSIGIIYSSWTSYLPSLKFLVQSILDLSVAQGVGDQHDLWPTDLKINRDHLLIKDYLPTKFEASGAKPSWVISCTRLRETDIPTDRPTDRHVQRNMPLLFQRGA